MSRRPKIQKHFPSRAPLDGVETSLHRPPRIPPIPRSKAKCPQNIWYLLPRDQSFGMGAIILGIFGPMRSGERTLEGTGDCGVVKPRPLAKNAIAALLAPTVLLAVPAGSSGVSCSVVTILGISTPECQRRSPEALGSRRENVPVLASPRHTAVGGVPQTNILRIPARPSVNSSPEPDPSRTRLPSRLLEVING